jgi:hypothetical protein
LYATLFQAYGDVGDVLLHVTVSIRYHLSCLDGSRISNVLAECVVHVGNTIEAKRLLPTAAQRDAIVVPGEAARGDRDNSQLMAYLAGLIRELRDKGRDSPNVHHNFRI